MNKECQKRDCYDSKGQGRDEMLGNLDFYNDWRIELVSIFDSGI